MPFPSPALHAGRVRSKGRSAVFTEDLLRLSIFKITPPGEADMHMACRAFVAFGKGSGHPASFNFGDLFSHTLAKG